MIMKIENENLKNLENILNNDKSKDNDNNNEKNGDKINLEEYNLIKSQYDKLLEDYNSLKNATNIQKNESDVNDTTNKNELLNEQNKEGKYINDLEKIKIENEQLYKIVKNII